MKTKQIFMIFFLAFFLISIFSISVVSAQFFQLFFKKATMSFACAKPEIAPLCQAYGFLSNPGAAITDAAFGEIVKADKTGTLASVMKLKGFADDPQGTMLSEIISRSDASEEGKIAISSATSALRELQSQKVLGEKSDIELNIDKEGKADGKGTLEVKKDKMITKDKLIDLKIIDEERAKGLSIEVGEGEYGYETKEGTTTFTVREGFSFNVEDKEGKVLSDIKNLPEGSIIKIDDSGEITSLEIKEASEKEVLNFDGKEIKLAGKSNLDYKKTKEGKKLTAQEATSFKAAGIESENAKDIKLNIVVDDSSTWQQKDGITTTSTKDVIKGPASVDINENGEPTLYNLKKGASLETGKNNIPFVSIQDTQISIGPTEKGLSYDPETEEIKYIGKPTEELSFTYGEQKFRAEEGAEPFTIKDFDPKTGKVKVSYYGSVAQDGTVVIKKFESETMTEIRASMKKVEIELEKGEHKDIKAIDKWCKKQIEEAKKIGDPRERKDAIKFAEARKDYMVEMTRADYVGKKLDALEIKYPGIDKTGGGPWSGTDYYNKQYLPLLKEKQKYLAWANGVAERHSYALGEALKAPLKEEEFPVMEISVTPEMPEAIKIKYLTLEKKQFIEYLEMDPELKGLYDKYLEQKEEQKEASTIAGTAFIEYKVKKEDTLSEILVKTFGLKALEEETGLKGYAAIAKKVSDIAAYNKIEDPDLIYPGRIIRLPGAKGVPAASTTVVPKSKTPEETNKRTDTEIKSAVEPPSKKEEFSLTVHRGIGVIASTEMRFKIDNIPIITALGPARGGLQSVEGSDPKEKGYIYGIGVYNQNTGKYIFNEKRLEELRKKYYSSIDENTFLKMFKEMEEEVTIPYSKIDELAAKLPKLALLKPGGDSIEVYITQDGNSLRQIESNDNIKKRINTLFGEDKELAPKFVGERLVTIKKFDDKIKIERRGLPDLTIDLDFISKDDARLLREIMVAYRAR